MIRTKRLRLIPCDEALLRAIVAGPGVAARHLGVVVAPNWPEFPEAYVHALEKLAGGEDLRPWWTYVFLDDRRGALVGSGGFTGRPTPAGVVELGYETVPVFRGKGYATEAAKGMVDFAFGYRDITAVEAHTLAERNASVRVLERNGFTQLGAIDHPEDGMLWHWRIKREEWPVRS